jgi:hypothetical protein
VTLATIDRCHRISGQISDVHAATLAIAESLDGKARRAALRAAVALYRVDRALMRAVVDAPIYGTSRSTTAPSLLPILTFRRRIPYRRGRVFFLRGTS